MAEENSDISNEQADAYHSNERGVSSRDTMKCNFANKTDLTSSIFQRLFTVRMMWILKGLFVCFGILLIGIVGSLTLKQMDTPQIESLRHERARTRQNLESLQKQYDNITRIAESRLEMIHILEKELEKQVLLAVTSAHPASEATAKSLEKTDISNTKHFFTTIFYVCIVGVAVLLFVFYRIFHLHHQVESTQINRRVNTNVNALREKVTTPTSQAVAQKRTMGSSGMRLNILHDEKNDVSSQCYKRAPGSMISDIV